MRIDSFHVLIAMTITLFVTAFFLYELTLTHIAWLFYSSYDSDSDSLCSSGIDAYPFSSIGSPGITEVNTSPVAGILFRFSFNIQIFGSYSFCLQSFKE